MSGWDNLPNAHSPWEHYFPAAGDAEAARLDFMVSWNSVRHLPFADPLRKALKLADERPLKTPSNRGALYSRFISFAASLQKESGDKTIFLPTRTIGELLGCEPTTASRLRRLAVRDGLLSQVKPHRFRSDGNSKATEFRFNADRLRV
jgi:hypothetical protein